MRNTITIVLMVLVVAGCQLQKDMIIDSDYSYNGRFKKYKTFDFFREVNESDSSRFNAKLEDALVNRLEAQGYKRKEKRPDLLIGYKIYYSDLKFKGYYQPELDIWVKNTGGEVIDKIDTLESERELSREEKRNIRSENYEGYFNEMKNGMLLINFFDRKKEETVWQGYASGIFYFDDRYGYNDFKKPASRILDEFRVVAEGYILN